MHEFSTDDQLRVTTAPTGLETTTAIGADGVRSETLPDGTTIETTQGPDPRFGMLGPVSTSQGAMHADALTQPTLAANILRTATLLDHQRAVA